MRLSVPRVRRPGADNGNHQQSQVERTESRRATVAGERISRSDVSADNDARRGQSGPVPVLFPGDQREGGCTEKIQEAQRHVTRKIVQPSPR